MGFSEFLAKNLLYYPVAYYQAGPIWQHQAFLAKSQYLPRLELEDLQQARLSQLLAHSAKHVPYYQARLSHLDNSATPSDLNIKALPFLLKSDLQQSGPDLLSTASLGKLAPKTTGGSTGQPVTVWKDRRAWAWELAATWRGYAWAGIDIGDRQARFWGVPHSGQSKWRAKAIDFVCNRLRIPAFSFSEADLASYVHTLNKVKPRYFYGYVSMLAEFARFLQRKHIRLDFPLKSIVTTSEVLSPIDRTLLQETFGAPVYNEYGCGELGTIAHECDAGSLHLSEENMLIEVLQDDQTCDAGQAGELVITELNNLGFPLIRYRTGDFGAIDPKPCSCGRSLRVLSSIQGRAYDFIRNKKGQLFHGEFIMYIFEDLRRIGAQISQFQVIQQDLDVFSIRLVANQGYDSSSESFISQRIRSHVDADATVNFTYVDSIAREKSGKLRLIKGLGT